MVREKVTVSTRTLQWKCVESRTDSKRLYYGRFILSPLMKGQADTIGIAMRRALLGEIEGTCITRVKSENVSHEYSTITGIQESAHEIIMNLKEIVLRSNLYGTCDASICVRGPGYVTARDIILPPYVEIVDNTQHIASLTEPINLRIGLEIERNRGYLIKMPHNFQDGSYPVDAVFMPVRNVNHSIHSYGNGNGNEKQEILFLEIWTNGSLTPKEALHEASRNLIDLFIPFLYKEEENLLLEDNQHMVPLSPFTFHNKLDKVGKNKIALKSIFIDQFELSPRVYNCLIRSNIYTLLDLMNKSQEDLMKIEHFRLEDVKQILGILEKNFAIFLPKKKF
uniref:DNA-directed RNA polymerase subunit alpha n=1 Tax=Isodon tenuifolius TaxID=2494293 RepID=A0A977XPC5_9LAMI|nr:RNA polymerase alpha subunit [Isodon adenanthus]YP_010522860.1 RNA polymerase alpha subunit [Isodon loxothyrsus]YP_010524444.1 RNA polymerase alpha subunit [Isodon tenuifolius]YP_010524884.1 RNA polymerase alpha subunit [Isodon wikstroemioides]YP_010530220.1 RNA polymerase alpha subunit [Isodon coetsa]UXP77038.1 RNA polymerase alpha subunit [Isodon adenanthus]UXP80470.1 RNA polymerase alpha subunit [Isodon loxothyrsus]UXP82494.1 RNA polymerase alpha subunit [Isodon tenuifolius]UXP82934.1